MKSYMLKQVKCLDFEFEVFRSLTSYLGGPKM